MLQFLWILLLCLLRPGPTAAACQSCVFLPTRRHHHRASNALWGQVSTLVQQSTKISAWKQLAVHNLYRQVRSKPVVAATAAAAVTATCFLPVIVKNPHPRRPWGLPFSDEKQDGSKSLDEPTDSEESDDESTTTSSPPKVAPDSPVSALGIYTLGIYKSFISPLLPPACRFVPTCSQYGVQAIQEFGPSKGSVLIAWRLLRCSPFGGKGYDPPKWPPVSYTYGSWK